MGSIDRILPCLPTSILNKNSLYGIVRSVELCMPNRDRIYNRNERFDEKQYTLYFTAVLCSTWLLPVVVAWGSLTAGLRNNIIWLIIRQRSSYIPYSDYVLCIITPYGVTFWENYGSTSWEQMTTSFCGVPFFNVLDVLRTSTEYL